MDYLDKPLQRLLGGFIRLHVLYHAEEGGIYGNWMIEELRHHGYKISPGTLYPMLRAMEKDGWIVGSDENGGNRGASINHVERSQGPKGSSGETSRTLQRSCGPNKKRGQA